MSLVLDHVSLQTPSVDAAIALLRDRLGLITTPTPAAPYSHGRVFLDRGYLEVAIGADTSFSLFFVRYDQLDQTIEALEGRGLRPRIGSYQGRDGAWQDIEMDASTAAPLPYLTRRITPPDVASDWPPPLASPHPCGAEALAAVHVRVARLGPALEVYEQILGLPAIALGEHSAMCRLGSGRIVLHEAADLPPAIVGIELRVSSLEDTHRCLSALETKTWRAEDVLWADLPGGCRLGFAAADSLSRQVQP